MHQQISVSSSCTWVCLCVCANVRRRHGKKTVYRDALCFFNWVAVHQNDCACPCLSPFDYQPSSTSINIYLVQFTPNKCMVCGGPNEMLSLIPIPQTLRNTLSLKSIHWCKNDERLRGRTCLPIGNDGSFSFLTLCSVNSCHRCSSQKWNGHGNVQNVENS